MWHSNRMNNCAWSEAGKQSAHQVSSRLWKAPQATLAMLIAPSTFRGRRFTWNVHQASSAPAVSCALLERNRLACARQQAQAPSLTSSWKKPHGSPQVHTYIHGPTLDSIPAAKGKRLKPVGRLLSAVLRPSPKAKQRRGHRWASHPSAAHCKQISEQISVFGTCLDGDSIHSLQLACVGQHHGVQQDA